MRKQVILFLTLIIFATTLTFGQPQKDTVVDIDSNLYHTVKIGTQLWMIENLKVTHYRNGKPIPNMTRSKKWSKLMTGAYCNYKNDTNISKASGRLYNWYAIIDTNGIAPIGWHVASHAEWTKLLDFLGGESVAYKLKSTSDWPSILSDSTNNSGFTALPCGYRDYDGNFKDAGYYCVWWSSTNNDGTCSTMCRVMNYETNNVLQSKSGENNGFSVRCVKDY